MTVLIGYPHSQRSLSVRAAACLPHDSHLPYDDDFISRRKEQQLWSMLDRDERGYLTRSDFMQPPTLQTFYRINVKY
jgi:hypothetical protein